MSNLNRRDAFNAIAELTPMPPSAQMEKADVSIYGEDVFDSVAMREYLPQATCDKLLATIERGEPIDAAIAGDVAHAMKEWALSKGATSYTHWFQPLTGSTAEKHDSFLEPSGSRAIFTFSGKNLIVGEPDASSFPSGGLRSTFEARGYTAWDPTSPAFIKRHGNGATLCIPTAFCSYTGDALDWKTPLLRSLQAVKNATRRLMRCFGLPENETVSVTLGAEQEYFLVDKHFYLQRPDLLQTGRTLFGTPPARHQQLEVHYFGSIKLRILNFMTEVERELWRLGIPAKTRHNESAPAQFELAPIFEEVNLACDHNMLIMETLRQVADRYGLVCLLHEKPFDGVNGSGKHNNWSISYGQRNLLNPGKNPQENAIFLTVLTSIISAVDEHSDLLRASATGQGNDYRLGGNEAPPSIISIYLGEQLTEVIEQLEKGEQKSIRKADKLRIGVDTLPPLPQDATDRNRTSPFAFTGNKFEFRMPGSSHTCSSANIVINTIVAEAFDKMAQSLEQFKQRQFHTSLQAHLQKLIRQHKRILFNGDGYTEEWIQEAIRRGLPHACNTVEALSALVSEKNVAFFEEYGVYNKRELSSRYEVFKEDYYRKLRIEGEVALELASSMIAPAVSAEYAKNVAMIKDAKAAGIKAGLQALSKHAEELGEKLDALSENCGILKSALNLNQVEKIIPAMKALRDVADSLERRVGDEVWPLPKYREMLFIY